MAIFSTAANQALLDKYFGKGVVTAGSGGGNAALANAPQALRDAYTKDRQAFDDQKNYAYAPAAGNVAPQANYNGGVSPIGQIEPLNDWQKAALTTQQAGYQDPGYSNSIFQALQGQQGAVNGLNPTLSDGQFQNLYNRYNNPYIQDVINASNSDIMRQADIARNPLKEQLAGNNSFGSSAQGIEMGQIDDAALRATAANSANLRSQGYQSAVGNALNNYQQDYSNALSKTGAFQSLLGSGIAGQQQGQQNFSQNVANPLQAGTAVQNQNQNLLNVVQGQIGGVQQYPYTQLSNFSQLLSPFNGGSSTGYSYSPSAITQAGGLGLLGSAGFYDPKSQSMGNSFSLSNYFGGLK